MAVSIGDIERTIESCTLADRRRLRARLRGLARKRGDTGRIMEKIARDAAEAARRRAARAARVPPMRYPDDLPVAARREEIIEAIRVNRVIVVCGETGSGKTTQLPKMCLEAGLGVDGVIGHTQPRRVAARSVAARIAEEMGVELGGFVGSKVRFDDETGEETAVKVMTDGLLLAETQGDRRLERYDAVIVDEAHERSLNIDFLLGYLRRLVDERPELRVIITSATIDPERFSRRFDVGGRPAPIIEVSGRTYPVEVRYRPLVTEGAGEDDLDLSTGVVRAYDELCAEGQGDVLVFMPGEREIRETADALRKRTLGRAGVEILPLYARLSPSEQQRVFRAHTGRRIVIATNVAETSLTVPGVRYVIDSGVARISRYSARSKVQGLPVEAISKASAEQRKGRCGRIGPGICVRLYDEQDYGAREPFTQPEILRTNLASVVLQMKALRLGEPEDFPFVEPPDSRMIRDGVETLRELGAIDDGGGLTEIGRRLARLPADPRIGRIVLAGHEEDCLAEVLVIASAMSVQDPRDRPADRQDAADEAHARFAHPDSDFLAYLNMWAFTHELAARLSRSKMNKALRQVFISPRRMSEWREVYRQLRALAQEMGLRPRAAVRSATDAPYDAVHRALLTGLLANVAKKREGHEYAGARGGALAIFPGSGLFSAKPRWIVAGEVVRTTKLYARTVAKVQPEWIERVGAHLLTRSYSDPEWDPESGRVVAKEKVSLFGLELASGRLAHYGPVDPDASRELFIHHALVEGEMKSDAPALRHNRALQRRYEALEQKARRRDLLADSRARHAFYDARIPPGVYSRRTFERWLRDAETRDPGVLRMTPEDLLRGDPSSVGPDAYPDRVEVAGTPLRLAYRHETGDASDGVTVTVPLEVLGRLRAEDADWLVPGHLEERIAALVRTLPKAIRRQFDAGAIAKELTPLVRERGGDLLENLAGALTDRAGVPVRVSDLRPQELAPHLRPRFRVVDADGRELGVSRDVGELRARFGAKAAQRFAEAAGKELRRDGLTSWDFGDLPETVELSRHGGRVEAYPALIDREASVSIRVLDSRDRAAAAHEAGVARLFAFALRRDARVRAQDLPGIGRLRLLHSTIGPAEELDRDLMRLVAEEAFVRGRPPVRSADAFHRRFDEEWGSIGRAIDAATGLAARIIEGRQRVLARIGGDVPGPWREAAADARDQLGRLFGPRFLARTPRDWLARYPCYMDALLRRFERLRGAGIDRDTDAMRRVRAWWGRYAELAERRGSDVGAAPELALLRWMIEEYRVSLFAQELGTAVPVSERRLEAQLERARRERGL